MGHQSVFDERVRLSVPDHVDEAHEALLVASCAVAQPLKDLAQGALEALLTPKPGQENRTNIFPPELVLRASCGCH